MNTFDKRKIKAGITLLGGAFLAAGIAEAAPSLIAGESIQFKYRNWEQFQGMLLSPAGDVLPPAPGVGLSDGVEDLRGLVQMTSIFQPITSSTPIWSPTATDQIWGVFYGFDLDKVVPAGSGFNWQFVGGKIDMYLLGAEVNPYTLGVGGFGSSDSYTGITGPTPWLTLSFDPGVTLGSPATTLDANIDAGTAPFTGDGAGYLSTSTNLGKTGTVNASLDTNTILDGQPAPGIHDLFLQNNFRTAKDVNGNGFDDLTGIKCEGAGCAKFVGTGAAGSGWHLLSEDPVIGFVPEPGSLFLLGAGLAGLAAVGRRRKAL